MIMFTFPECTKDSGDQTDSKKEAGCGIEEGTGAGVIASGGVAFDGEDANGR